MCKNFIGIDVGTRGNKSYLELPSEIISYFIMEDIRILYKESARKEIFSKILKSKICCIFNIS